MMSRASQGMLLASVLGILGLSATSSRAASAPSTGSPPSATSLAAYLQDAGAVAVADDTVSWSKDVMPIIQEHCAGCHGGEDEDGEVITEAYLNLLSYEDAMMGSENGTVIEPGDPDNSVLIDLITSGEMPDEGDPVPPEQIEVFRQWIAQGALDN
jgi:hypothetical protein